MGTKDSIALNHLVNDELNRLFFTFLLTIVRLFHQKKKRNELLKTDSVYWEPFENDKFIVLKLFVRIGKRLGREKLLIMQNFPFSFIDLKRFGLQAR